MKVKIIGVGKLKEKYLKQGISEYAKRMSAFAKFEVIEVPDEKAPENLSESQMVKIKQIEGERILEKIKDKEYVFVLAIKGKELSSEELADKFADLMTYGKSDITFVIGGSLGTSEEVNNRADMLISFGRFTLPHQLMRLVLSEQIYRGFMIDAGRTYHK